MNLEQRRRSLTAFYFGRTAATLETDDDALVTVAAKRAYRDLNRTLHGIGTHPNAEQLRQDTYDSLKKFVNNLDDVHTVEVFDKLHQAWCEATIDRFAAQNVDRNKLTMDYGQAQKWLNMTLKYLVVLNYQP